MISFVSLLECCSVGMPVRCLMPGAHGQLPQVALRGADRTPADLDSSLLECCSVGMPVRRLMPGAHGQLPQVALRGADRTPADLDSAGRQLSVPILQWGQVEGSRRIACCRI